MPARLIPERPRYANDTERIVTEALVKKLPDEAVVIHGQRFFGQDGDWEADLAVLYPGCGFAAIEIKGGKVWLENGEWKQRTRDGERIIEPVEQARSASYLFQRYLNKRPEWTHGRIRKAHFVILPGVEWGPELESPALPREICIAGSELSDAAGRIYDVFNGYLPDEPNARPSVEAVNLAADLIGGRPPSGHSVRALRSELDEHVERLTSDQAKVLRIVRDNSRIEVLGGPGTGKTWLAMEQARRLAAEGQRVALLCYSRGLALWIAREIANWPTELRGRVWPGTFHALGVRWGAAVRDGDDQHFWEVELPELMLALADELPAEHRFDALIVDEAQDFADSWWPPLLASLVAPDDSGVYVFGDPAQSVFGREGRPRVALMRVRLDENVRNTQQIARVVKCLSSEQIDLLGGEGPPVRFVPAESTEVYDEADRVVEGLLEEGWEPRDIVILTTNHRHPMHRARTKHDGRDGYWESFWDDEDYFYATVPGFKGLERPAVVLAVDGFRDSDLAREVLYVGLSRARDLLVVVGDLDVIGEAGGRELRKRLAKASRAGE